jgi:hypothetical protein
METEPANPSQGPAYDRPISELGDGSSAADGGHDALITVGKRSEWPTPETGQDLSGRMSA